MGRGIRDAFGAHQGLIRRASGAHSARIRDAFGAHQGRMRRASGTHAARIRDAFGAHQGRIRRASGTHSARIRDVWPSIDQSRRTSASQSSHSTRWSTSAARARRWSATRSLPVEPSSCFRTLAVKYDPGSSRTTPSSAKPSENM